MGAQLFNVACITAATEAATVIAQAVLVHHAVATVATARAVMAAVAVMTTAAMDIARATEVAEAVTTTAAMNIARAMQVAGAVTTTAAMDIARAMEAAVAAVAIVRQRLKALVSAEPNRAAAGGLQVPGLKTIQTPQSPRILTNASANAFGFGSNMHSRQRSHRADGSGVVRKSLRGQSNGS